MVQSGASNVDGETRALLQLWHALPPAQRARVYRYAASLKRDAPMATTDVTPRAACDVVAALRALVRRYPGLERRHLVAQAGELLAQHQMEGRPAADVIAELEQLFELEAARLPEGR